MHRILITVALATQLVASAMATNASPLGRRSRFDIFKGIKVPHSDPPPVPKPPISRPNGLDGTPPPQRYDPEDALSGYTPPKPLPRAPGDPSPNAGKAGMAPRTRFPCSHGDRSESCEKLAETALELIKSIEDAMEIEDEVSDLDSSNVHPNLNMSEWMSGSDYAFLYTNREFALLRENPICFFSTYRRLYGHYAELGSHAPSSLDGNERGGSVTAVDREASLLYHAYLPSQISMVYRSTPTSVTVSSTGTTSCSAFTVGTRIIKAFTTTYDMFDYVPGYGPMETMSAEEKEDGPESGALRRAVGSLSMVVAAGLFMLS